MLGQQPIEDLATFLDITTRQCPHEMRRIRDDPRTAILVGKTRILIVTQMPVQIRQRVTSGQRRLDVNRVPTTCCGGRHVRRDQCFLAFYGRSV